MAKDLAPAETEVSPPKDSPVAKTQNSKLVLILALVVVAVVAAGGVWLWSHGQINNLKKTDATKDSQIATLQQQIATLKKVPASNVSFKITKSDLFQDTPTYYMYFITIDFTNNGSTAFKFSLSDLKLKDTTNNTTLTSYLEYPGQFNYDYNAYLKDQSIQPGETISGFQEMPLDGSLKLPQQITAYFTDNVSKVTTTQSVTVSSVATL